MNERLPDTELTPESAADRLIEALENLAQNASTSAEQERAHKAAEALRGMGREVFVHIMTDVLTGDGT